MPASDDDGAQLTTAPRDSLSSRAALHVPIPPHGTAVSRGQPDGNRGHQMERRLATRNTGEWHAKYRFSPAADWRECRVIDMAGRGIAIEPFGLLDNEPLRGDVELKFELSEDIAEDLELLGDIRRATRISEGRVRLGIEFKALTDLDVMLLDLIGRVGRGVGSHS